MILLTRKLIDEALSEMMSPAQLQKFQAYRAARAVVADEHGDLFADLWAEARLVIEARGKVRLPPTGWDFVPSVRGLSHGVKPEFDPHQRSQWRAFWDWYLPVENHLTRLIHLIRTLDAWKPKHAAFRAELCGVAGVIHDQYEQWLRSGRIAWLPVDRGGERSRNIVQRLGQALIDCDTGPATDAPDQLMAGEWRY